jgi:hypothetical protein
MMLHTHVSASIDEHLNSSHRLFELHAHSSEEYDDMYFKIFSTFLRTTHGRTQDNEMYSCTCGYRTEQLKKTHIVHAYEYLPMIALQQAHRGELLTVAYTQGIYKI